MGTVRKPRGKEYRPLEVVTRGLIEAQQAEKALCML
jgi:hypothetical protein